MNRPAWSRLGRRGRTRGCTALLALLGSGCLIGPNPAFIEADTEASSLSATNDRGQQEADAGPSPCPDGLLDCDDEPGCEASVDDPQSCGSCFKQCELGGQALSCEAGMCTGVLEWTDLQDAYVDAGLPNTNFGDLAVLQVDATHSIYVELPGLDDLPNGTVLESVALHLRCSQTGSAVALHRVETQWDEATITEANAPAIDGVALLMLEPTFGENVIELVDMIDEWQKGSPKRSVGLRPDPSEPSPALVEFSSGEGPSPPFLVIELSW